MIARNGPMALAIAALALGLSAPAQAQDAASPAVITRATISQAGALAMAQAVRTRAAEQGDAISMAIVDAGGNLLYFERMDGAVLASIDIALAKARTSVGLGAPTQIFAGMARQSSESVLGLLSADFALMSGGRPIIIDGQLVGAVAVSGARNDGDDLYSIAALDAVGGQH